MIFLPEFDIYEIWMPKISAQSELTFKSQSKFEPFPHSGPAIFSDSLEMQS